MLLLNRTHPTVLYWSMVSNTQNEQKLLNIYGRNARSMMKDFPFLSIRGYGSINLYSYISPMSCIYKHISQSMDRHIRSKRQKVFSFPFSYMTYQRIQINSSLSYLYHMFCVCVCVCMCVNIYIFCESARIK